LLSSLNDKLTRSVHKGLHHHFGPDSIGIWRHYAEHLGPFIEEFQKYLPHLHEIGALSDDADMNWDIDLDYLYSKQQHRPSSFHDSPTDETFKTAMQSSSRTAHVPSPVELCENANYCENTRGVKSKPDVMTMMHHD
jgi:hypothetical protein